MNFPALGKFKQQ